MISAFEAVTALTEDAPRVLRDINDFTAATFRTRGGRLGSGMGSLLEALWVYHMNRALQNEGGEVRKCELAWLEDHEPADFTCLYRDAVWSPASKEGELFRIEAKSMNVGVDEAKGHFTNLAHETAEHDQLLVLIWSWTTHEGYYVWPRIHDYFLGPSLSVIALRDALHKTRRGSFVLAGACPDGCDPATCTHVGEPLNAAGKRERRSGPVSCRPANVEYAANFGGLVRMIKTDGDEARAAFRRIRKDDDVAHRYISFIHDHYPKEELNQYKRKEWQELAAIVGVATTNLAPMDLVQAIREAAPNYRDILRTNFA